MNLTGNTILVTGGGAGSGRGLAEVLCALGNQVVIAGRRLQVLRDTTAANPGMKSLLLDVESPTAIRAFATEVAGAFPTLNVLINNAGIMRAEKLLAQPEGLLDAEAIVANEEREFVRAVQGTAIFNHAQMPRGNLVVDAMIQQDDAVGHVFL